MDKNNIDAIIESSPKQNKKSFTYITNCEKCGKEFSQITTQYLINNKRCKRFCSRSCANSHVRTEDSKKKVSESLNNFYINIPKSIRDEISAFVKNNSGKLRTKQECKADYFQNKDGTYTVYLKIIAPIQPMLELKFVIPDKKTAQNIYKSWASKASDLYSAIYETLVD